MTGQESRPISWPDDITDHVQQAESSLSRSRAGTARVAQLKRRGEQNRADMELKTALMATTIDATVNSDRTAGHALARKSVWLYHLAAFRLRGLILGTWTAGLLWLLIRIAFVFGIGYLGLTYVLPWVVTLIGTVLRGGLGL